VAPSFFTTDSTKDHEGFTKVIGRRRLDLQSSDQENGRRCALFLCETFVILRELRGELAFLATTPTPHGQSISLRVR
jgi:hypothetical protein